MTRKKSKLWETINSKSRWLPILRNTLRQSKSRRAQPAFSPWKDWKKRQPPNANELPLVSILASRSWLRTSRNKRSFRRFKRWKQLRLMLKRKCKWWILCRLSGGGSGSTLLRLIRVRKELALKSSSNRTFRPKIFLSTRQLQMLPC